MRKLASIQKVKNLESIEGADLIEKATVEGWSVVVQKGLHKVGDLVCFCEIDSVFPDAPEFEFLRARKFRIKTVKLRGQISQGICFPMSVLEGKKYDADMRVDFVYSFEEGMDVTELLKIEKYEPPVPAHLSGLVKGNFPGFLFKTDEERVQNIEVVLERHRGKEFYYSEKLDGTSMSVYFYDEFGVCSRKLDLKETESNAYWQVARIEKIEEKLKTVGNVAVQGELIGPGIQGNKYKVNSLQFKLFNVFDIKEGKYYDFYSLLQFAKDLGFCTVPILSSAFILEHTVSDLLQMADGNSKLNPLGLREGIVFRTIAETHDPDLGRLSFKAISNKYLLKHGE